MAQILAPKRSTETVLYSFDFTEELKATGDGIESYTLTVATGTVTLSQQSNDGLAVSCLIAGGTDGVTQAITLTVNTLFGQVWTRDISLLISDTAIVVYPQTATKRTLCEMAFEEIGLAGYEFDTTPEEYASALRRMDTLLGQWRGPGMNIFIPYNTPPYVGGSDLADESGIPDFAVNAVAISLALRVMPLIGKTMSAETRIALKQGMDSIRAAFSVIPQRVLPYSTIRGAGGKPWASRNPYMNTGNARPTANNGRDLTTEDGEAIITEG